MTTNLKDCPATALEVYSLAALHLDDFIVVQIDLDLYPALGAFEAMGARKRNPDYSAEDFATAMERNGLVATAERLRPRRASELFTGSFLVTEVWARIQRGLAAFSP